MKRSFSSLCIAIVIAVSGVAAFGQNYKIKQTVSMQGMDMTTTVYVKGSRKRTESSGMMGMGADVATIEQCDLNRTVQVNDKKKLYTVSENRSDAATTRDNAGRPGAPGTITKGGTVTQTYNITDTGERKQMFGLLARHLKTSMSMVSSPDACNKTDMSMETDGWYVDLPQFSCPMQVPQNPYSHGGERSGCQDKVISKSTGAGKLGFPLEMTQTMRSGGQNSFSQTITTVEFSKSALDDGLFNVPADYRLANSPQDLYGQPDMSGMMSGRQDPANDYGATNPNISRQNANMNGKRPGMVRIGVLMPTNRNGDPVSTSGLQSYLASELRQGKVEGLVVSSESEARAAGCDYLLTSDISKLKQSTAGKVGGIFGKVTGVPTAGVYDAQVEFTLVSLADGRNVLKTKLANKAETDATRAAEAVLSSEAQAVLAAAK